MVKAAAAFTLGTGLWGTHDVPFGRKNVVIPREVGMPFPRTLARWNKAGLNRLTKHTAPLTPGMGVIIHRGRRSGRRFQTPVNVFRTEDGFLFALTYGPDSDWVKNVLAAGGGELRTRGRTVQVVAPRLVHDESRRGIRPLERQVLRLMGVADFLAVKTAACA